MLESQIEEVLDYQVEYRSRIPDGTPRDITDEVGLSDTQVKILTGIRRCGKSTAMLQMARRFPDYNYLSFEDPRLSAFEVNDFFKLEKIFNKKGGSDRYFFDEIQNVEEWEKYIRVLLDRRANVVVTGSNARMLSKELGTMLTGRQISYEVYPFSFAEYLVHFGRKAEIESFAGYLLEGGMPEYLNTMNSEILFALYNDLIYRDIVVRYGLRNPKTVNGLGIFLASNVGKEFSYNGLAKSFELGSSNTVASYLSYFEDAYLFFSIPRFSYSLKQQLKNPKKVYGIDTGLVAHLSMSFSQDRGRLLENLVFIHLKRLGFEIHYFRQNGECDFIVSKNRKIDRAIQVSYNLNSDNFDREVNGLTEAAIALRLNKGLILTYNQQDELERNGIRIIIQPVWQWILDM